MEFPILSLMEGLSIALFKKRLNSFVFTQKGFLLMEFCSIWLLQESAEKDS